MEFEVKGFKYRVKKMNAIELLALRSFVSFDSIDKLIKCYSAFLERLEVYVADGKWIQVKQGQAYFPAGIEDDFETIQTCVTNMLAYVHSVFQKSDASNKQQG